MNELQALLKTLRELEIQLWEEDGKLRFRAPQGRMTPELGDRLRASKDDLLAFLKHSLKSAADDGPLPVRIDRDGPLPLSPMQRRMLFIEDMNPGSAVYHLPLGLRLRGPLCEATLCAALSALVARHEALRMRFDRGEGEGEYRLRIAAPEALLLAVEAIAASALDVAALHEIEQPFDLQTGPLLRARLYRLDDGTHALLIVMHHIVSDGWSTVIVVRELGEYYRAAANGEAPSLPPLPLEYVDFADWCARLSGAGALETQEAYWRATLEGAATVLDLPTDHVRPPMQGLEGATHRFDVPGALRARLLEFCRRQGATPYAVLLAAFDVWLMRYAEQTDIAVGMVTANRRPEFQHAIGMFMNTLVLRSRLDADTPFDRLLGEVSVAVLEAQEHQDVAFERLVEICRPQRSLSHTPLFQVMLMYQESAPHALGFGDLQAEDWVPPNAYAKYDLTLSFMDGADGLHGGIEYATALFRPETVERIAGQFLLLLDALLAHPQRRVGEHPLLTGAELLRLTLDWNATDLDYVAEPIHRQLERQAMQTPEASALIDGECTLSYAQLWCRVAAVADHLTAVGVAPGERVGVFMERSADMVIALLAVLRCGAAYVPLDPSYPRERLRFVCEDAGLRRLLVQSFVAPEVPDRALEAIEVDTLLAHINADLREPQTTLSAAVSPEHTAYMIYTSGSTGRPKGVSVSHRNVANFFAALDQRDIGGGIEPAAQPCWLAVTSMSFDISVLELLWTLARGHKVVLQPANIPASLLPALAQAVQPDLDFSLFYFASDSDGDHTDKYRLLLEGAGFADREGFEAVWVPERHFHAFGGQFPNPSVAAAAVAAVTQRVKVRAGSVVLPLHDPLRIAEEWSMVDNLSQGRAGIAFASGWHFNDFVFFPDNFEQRHRIMREGVETVRALWRGDRVVRHGGTGKETQLMTRPRPVQPELPVWITAAASPETFRYAGEIGANVLTHLLGQSLEELREKIGMYRQARLEHGHDPQAGRVTLMIHTFIGDDLDEVRRRVEQPFKQYLRTSVGLLRPVAEHQGLDLELDIDAVVDAGFERYVSSSALFGTPDSCLETVGRIRSLGVDEVACLIDFGLDVDVALGGLDGLARLRGMAKARQARLRHFDRARDVSALDLIRRHRVTHLQSTPTFAGMLLDQIDADGEVSGLRHWLVGGEALPAQIAARIRSDAQVRLFNMYGPTETTVWSSNDIVDEHAITLGRPLANTQLYVLDPRGLPVPVGATGELHIAGDGVTQGYWQRPDLTAERFLPDPFAARPGARMYRTGDNVRYLPDGRLQFIGRSDGQIKLRGFRIELGEIETQLQRQPGVREAAVRVHAANSDDPRLLAYVVPDRVLQVDADDARWPVSCFAFPDGTAIFHSDERQLGALYKEVFEDRMYLRHGIVLEDHACVFDVGANVGSFSVFAQHNCRNPHVHSFEPIPPTFAALRRNAHWHGIDGKVHNCGLSDRDEVQPFTYYPQMSGLSGRFANAEEEIRAARTVVLDQLQQESSTAQMSEQEIGEWLADSFRSQTFDCRLRTLSDVIAEEGIEQIDLLKIDVEKSECLVLAGITDVDWPKIQQLTIEVDGEENLSKVKSTLQARGYRLVVDDFVNVQARDGIEQFDVYMVYARREQVARPLPRPETPETKPLCVDRLRLALKAQLPEHMVPDEIMLLDALPRTPNGKLDAAALPSEAPRAQSQSLPPRSQQERSIAEIWSRTLGRPVAGIHDNFFESGGNSLLVARVRGELQKAFGISISVVDLFRYPTIAALATHLTRDGAAEAAAARTVTVANDRGAQRRERMARRGRAPGVATEKEEQAEDTA